MDEIERADYAIIERVDDGGADDAEHLSESLEWANYWINDTLRVQNGAIGRSLSL